ncbi:MAG: hypothetical protein AAF378_22775 [Cyanobacteria bacterium P01_A01_bin.84]
MQKSSAIKNVKELLSIGIQESNLNIDKNQEIEAVQINSPQEIQLDKSNIQETRTEKRR